MTPRKFDKCKVWVDNATISERVQLELFKLGYSWSGNRVVKYTDYQCIFINSDGYLYYSSDRDVSYFNMHGNKLITAGEIIGLDKKTIKKQGYKL